MQLMLKPGWPGIFRRTIAGVCYVFELGLLVDVPDAHAEELIERGEVPRVIWPARIDSKGRPKHDLETLAMLFGNAGEEPDGDASPDPEGSDPPPTKPPAKARTRKAAKKPKPELTEAGA